MGRPEYAHPDKVPSSEDVERLEKMTDMLSDIQSLNPHHGKHLKLPERVAILDDSTLSMSERNFVRQQYEYLDCVAALCPELLALFPDGSGDASIGSHRIFASQNPRRDDEKGKQQQQQQNLVRDQPVACCSPQYNGLQPQITLPQINGGLVPDSTDTSSAIKFAYGLLAKMNWQNRSNDSIFQYCQDLLSLFKKFHGAASETTERAHWLKLIHDLVYMRLVEKLHGRVIDVFSKHNFGTIFMTSVYDLASNFSSTFEGRLRQTLHSASGPINRLDLIEGMPFHKGGVAESSAELEHCFRKGQTETQSTLLKQVYKEMFVWHSHGTTEDGESAWEESPLNAKGDPDYVFYDEKGRSEFHKLFSEVMKAVKDSTIELRKAKTEAMNSAQSTSKKTRASDQHQQAIEQHDIDSLQYAVQDAVRAYSCLAGLREEFSEILQSHYAWLQDISKPSGTHEPGKGWKSLGGGSHKAIYSPLGQGNKSLRDHALSSASNSESSSPHKIDEPQGKGKGKSVETAETLPIADLEISDDYRLLENTATESGWRVAASDAVGVLCRHQASLNYIRRASRDVAEFVLHASIQPLVTQPDWDRRRMMSTAKLLTSFKGKNGMPLSDEEQIALTEFFDGRKRVKTEGLKFGGTNHAEGTGLCAHLLARVRDEVINHDVDHKTVDKSLLLPPREITDNFRQMSIPMGVNKRCCPVCHIMLEIVECESHHRFLYSGAHSDWSAVSIPRWIPKKFFDLLYDKVESVLRDALEWVVKENDLARSSESGGSRSAPESSDVDGDSSQFIDLMAMQDHGGSPRPVRPQFGPALPSSVSPSPTGGGRSNKGKALRRREKVAARYALGGNPGAPQQTPQSATDASTTSTPAFIYGKPSVSPTKRHASQETPAGEAPPSPTKAHRGQEGRRGGRGGARAGSSRDASGQPDQTQEP